MRAFDARTGRLRWTYQVKRRQYLAVALGRGGEPQEIVALALPQAR